MIIKKIYFFFSQEEKKIMLCQVCHRETLGEMGTGEFFRNSEKQSYWWCRLCKKCPHFNCQRLRCVKDNTILSHCGRKCLKNECLCEKTI